MVIALLVAVGFSTVSTLVLFGIAAQATPANEHTMAAASLKNSPEMPASASVDLASVSAAA